MILRYRVWRTLRHIEVYMSAVKSKDTRRGRRREAVRMTMTELESPAVVGAWWRGLDTAVLEVMALSERWDSPDTRGYPGAFLEEWTWTLLRKLVRASLDETVGVHPHYRIRGVKRVLKSLVLLRGEYGAAEALLEVVYASGGYRRSGIGLNNPGDADTVLKLVAELAHRWHVDESLDAVVALADGYAQSLGGGDTHWDIEEIRALLEPLHISASILSEVGSHSRCDEEHRGDVR